MSGPKYEESGGEPMSVLMLKAPSNECTQCGEDISSFWNDGCWPMEVLGQPVCDECWSEEMQFTCCCCEEYGDVEDQDRFVVVVDADEAGLDRPGIYAITRRPYYVSYIIGGHLYDWALSRVQDVPKGCDTDGYACGHLCWSCQIDLGLIAPLRRVA